MDPDLNAQTTARVILVGGLLLALLIGLIWAFNPSDEGGITFSAGDAATAPEDAPAPAPASPPPPEGTEELAGEEEPAPDEEPAPEPTPEPTETGPAAEELIAAAPEPGDTTVQVLDAGGGSTATGDAADALEDLGYQVINVTSARASLTETTIWFNDGAEDAAQALRAREDRVVELEENQGLSTGVDLHLLVGADWSG